MEEATEELETDEISMAELLLAAMGVEWLFGDERARLTQAQRREALRIPRVIRRELRRFLMADDAWDKERALPSFDYKTALLALATPVDEAKLADKIGQLDPADSIQLLPAALMVTRYLYDLIPKRTRQTPLGPEAVKPSAQDISAFRRAYAVINQPLLVLEDLNEGVLARDQVRTLETVYPDIHAAIRMAVGEALIDMKANHPRATLSHRRSKQLSVLLLDAGIIDQPLSALLQKNFTEKEAGDKPKTGSNSAVSKSAENEDLPLRRLENR